MFTHVLHSPQRRFFVLALTVCVLCGCGSRAADIDIPHSWDAAPAQVKNDLELRRIERLDFSPDGSSIAAARIHFSPPGATPPGVTGLSAVVFDRMGKRVAESTDEHGRLQPLFAATFPGIAVLQQLLETTPQSSDYMNRWSFSGDGKFGARFGGEPLNRDRPPWIIDLWSMEQPPRMLWQTALPSSAGTMPPARTAAYFYERRGRPEILVAFGNSHLFVLDRSNGQVLESFRPAPEVFVENLLVTDDGARRLLLQHDNEQFLVKNLDDPSQQLFSIRAAAWNQRGSLRPMAAEFAAGGRYVTVRWEWNWNNWVGFNASATVMDIYRLSDGRRVWRSTRAWKVALSQDAQWLAVADLSWAGKVETPSDAGGGMEIGRFVEHPQD